MQIIKGMEIAQEIKRFWRAANEDENISPVLAIILVGNQEDSSVYVNLKEKAVEYIHGQTRLVYLDEGADKATLIKNIRELNEDNQIHGIIVQLPLPQHLEPWREEILASINPDKDVDGFTPGNLGLLFSGNPGFISCAALGCLEVMERVYPGYREKEIILAGDSFDLVLPLAVTLIKNGARVRVVPEYTPDLAGQAEILVVEKGGPRVLKGEHLSREILLIDAGFYWESGKSCGNVDQASIAACAGYLLPVPGGLGPILIAKLTENLCRAARRKT